MPAPLMASLSVLVPAEICVSISLSFSILSCSLYLLGLAVGAFAADAFDSALTGTTVVLGLRGVRFSLAVGVFTSTTTASGDSMFFSSAINSSLASQRLFSAERTTESTTTYAPNERLRRIFRILAGTLSL